MNNNRSKETEIDKNSSEITLKTVRFRTQQTIQNAFDSEEEVLIEALPATGKTQSIPKIVNKNNTRATYLTSREDLYAEMKRACEKVGYEWKILPRSREGCPTADGEYDEAAAERMNQLYRTGVSPSRLHDEFNLLYEPDLSISRKLGF